MHINYCFLLRYPVRSFLLCGKNVTDKHTNRRTDLLMVKNVTEKRTNRQTDGQSDRLLTDMEKNVTDKQTNRWTNRKTERLLIGKKT